MANLEQYYQTTKEEVSLKNKNIFIAICLGNKFFLNKDKSINKGNILEYINWSLKRTKENILIVIADKIQLTNYIVRNKRDSEERNLKRVVDEGAKIYEEINILIETSFSKEERNQIEIIKWEQYEQEDGFYKKIHKLVYSEFETNNNFKQTIYETVKETVRDRVFTEEEYWMLCKYVLDEFSLIYSGVKIKNIYYDCLLYPYMDPTGYIFEDIKNGKIFLGLRGKLPIEKVAYVIRH